MAAPKRTRRERAPISISAEHAQVTSTTTIKIAKIAANQGGARLREVLYLNPTGLAADGTNFFKVQIKSGSTLLAEHSTSTAGEGAIAANTWISVPLETGIETLAAGSEIDLVLTETGTQTLPAGRVILHVEHI